MPETEPPGRSALEVEMARSGMLSTMPSTAAGTNVIAAAWCRLELTPELGRAGQTEIAS